MELITKKELAKKIGFCTSTLNNYLSTMERYRFKNCEDRRIMKYYYNLEFLEVLKAKFENREKFGRRYTNNYRCAIEKLERMIEEWTESK